MKNLEYNSFKSGTDLCAYVNSLNLEVVSIVFDGKFVYSYQLFYYKKGEK